ncbi:hypothetical protein B0T17DRAFT_586269 [Bombardia bombarda]|uniref:TauD/TfdA-like domain-containing protein n=1 Tax=Bombardia bombarda TaxID=252184 RepID=A0AA39XI73_9PEZI|nr:hypothetical protein B0T17DRAFT_586269 [Bombardia bombarda]
MDFSRNDLEAIQRVAGLLGLTVDELLTQRRGSSEPTQHPTQQKQEQQQQQQQQKHAQLQPQPSIQASVDRLHLQTPQGSNLAPLRDASLDLDQFGLHAQGTNNTGRESSESISPPGAQATGTEVILLNPQTVWFDCDVALWDFDESAGGGLATDNDRFPAGDGGESYVPVTPMQVDSSPGSDGTAREDEQDEALDDAETEDWAMITSPGSMSMSSFQTPISPSTGSAERRYHPIAPKSGRNSSRSTSGTSIRRARKKRSPYHGSKKSDTHLTRQVHACVRCRMQRNRCIPDPANPRGPCLTCQSKTVRMSRLPCLRYMVTDSTLFRTSLDYMSFYKSHPMIGPHYGDFHLERYWTGAPSKTLCLGQLGAMNFKVELQEFIPPPDSVDLDLKGRPMYAVPWAIADPDAVVLAISDYIDRSITQYIYSYLDDTDSLVWDIFQAAYRASVFPTPNRMLQKTLRLWVACRFIESKWRCWADNGRADDPILADNPKDPFYDWDSLPPYLDYQIASVIIHRVLSPLRQDVLRELQSTLNTHSPKDWYITFLTSFILLQNYEMQMQFQSQFAARRNANLFKEGFDWTAPRVRRMARLDAEQIEFMGQCRDRVVNKVVLPEGAAHTWRDLGLKSNASPYVHRSSDWPTEVMGDISWDSTSFASDEDFTLVLSKDDVVEVRAGLQHFNGLGLYGNEVTTDTFPLPTLGPRLARTALDIHRGKGFAVVRGLKPDDFSPEDNALIFLGISSYIGAKRGRQDEEGNMLMHIRDAKLSKAPQLDRPTRYSSRASTFHTDTFCDILALQTRNCAAEGGRNILASSWTVYNKLMATHPEVRELLAQPIWPFDSRGKFFECSTRPLLFYHGGRIILNFAREPLLGLAGVPRAAGLGNLSQAQRQALDIVEEIAQQSQIVLTAEPGDLLYVNNHGLLHSREAFEDAPGNARYLMRMWLKSPTLAWKLPRPLQEGSSRIYDDNELGEHWNIVDVPKVQFRLSERLTS